MGRERAYCDLFKGDVAARPESINLARQHQFVMLVDCTYQIQSSTRPDSSAFERVAESEGVVIAE